MHLRDIKPFNFTVFLSSCHISANQHRFVPPQEPIHVTMLISLLLSQHLYHGKKMSSAWDSHHQPISMWRLSYSSYLRTLLRTSWRRSNHHQPSMQALKIYTFSALMMLQNHGQQALDATRHIVQGFAITFKPFKLYPSSWQNRQWTEKEELAHQGWINLFLGSFE
mgnify:FL=1